MLRECVTVRCALPMRLSGLYTNNYLAATFANRLRGRLGGRRIWLTVRIMAGDSVPPNLYLSGKKLASFMNDTP